MTTLFINGSPNKNGNTVALAKKLLGDQSFEMLHLADYKIYDYGQDFSDDQFEEVLAKLFEADTIVIGSPVYWHSINDFVEENDFSGKTVIPFATPTISDLGESGNLLAEMAGTGNWEEGQRFSSSATSSEVAEWLTEIG